MARYSVIKYFGHFSQTWRVDAFSEEEAWHMAERNGKLQYQSFYREPIDIDSKGYVIDLDKKEKEEPPVTEREYYDWLREAISKGMIVTPEEYEKALGLPFHDVWR